MGTNSNGFQVNVSYDVRSVDTAAKSEQHFVEYEIQENKGFKG